MKPVKPPVMTAGASLQEQPDPDRCHEIGQVFKIVGGSWEQTNNSLKN